MIRKVLNGYHKSAVPKTPIKKVKYYTVHKRIQRTGNFIVWWNWGKKGSWATRCCLQHISWLAKKKKHNAKEKTKCIFGAVNRTRKAADERNCRTEGSKWNPKGCNEFFRKRPKKIGACSKFEYIFQFKQKNFESQLKKDYSVKKFCKVLTVSETGFYKWKRNRNKPKAWQILLQKIYEILDAYKLLITKLLYSMFLINYYIGAFVWKWMEDFLSPK